MILHFGAPILWIAFVGGVLWYLNHNQTDHKECSIFDLFKENGKLSRLATGYIVALGLASWIMWELMITSKMTEGYFGIYCTSVVGPLVAKMFIGKNGNGVQPSVKETAHVSASLDL